MDELLKKLLESQVLSEDTKTQLEEAIATQMADVIKEAKEAATTEAKLEMAEQWLEARDALIEALDMKVTELLVAEVEELKEDIAAFRDLEVEAAEKLTEAKLELAETVKADMKELVGQLDTFLTLQIDEEFAELKTDIMEAKKLDFGRRVFESFMDEYQVKFVSEDQTHVKLAEAEAKLQVVEAKLNEATATKAKMERTIKLEGLLEPLSGHQRSLMETILANVETKELEKAYGKFIGRVLKESTSAPATAPIVEGVDPAAKPVTPVVKSGDLVEESAGSKGAETLLTESEKRKLQRLAGIN